MNSTGLAQGDAVVGVTPGLGTHSKQEE